MKITNKTRMFSMVQVLMAALLFGASIALSKILLRRVGDNQILTIGVQLKTSALRFS